jgi:hypothetical protein
MAKASEPTSQPPAFEMEYRRLLKELPADDSGTDENELADEFAGFAITGPDAPPEVDVLGISISRAQSLMKSPEIPADEKARVLDDAGDYSGDETPGSPSEGSTSSQPAAMKPSGQTVKPPDMMAPPPSSHSVSQQPGRSMIRSILDEAGANRRRSNSGPTMFDTFKKMLPDMPSMPAFKVNTVSASQNSGPSVESRRTTGSGVRDVAPRADEDRVVSLSLSRGRGKTMDQQPTTPSALGFDGNVESLLTPTSPRSHISRVRSNSESSLYLKRKPTAASAFDDTSAWADVREMGSARFKAITDSFQNSSLRMPKLPTLKYNPKGDGDAPTASVDDLTQQNTALNTGASKINTYFNANIPNIRNSKKLIEVENPQQRAHPVLSDALGRLEGDLIILGGYRGSVLRDAKPPHRQLWAPVKIGLNLRNVDLEVGLTREDEENAHQKVIPSGTLSHIGPIDICRRLLKHAKKCPNTRDKKLRLHDWGYDWRLSPDLIGERLIRFLESLECNQPETPPERRGATVIAHSLGGLITRWAVNKRPELFAGVVYAGVPQHCVNILGPLRNGDNVLLSQKVLTAQVNFTIRTSFALLPENGRCFINKHTNERYDLNLFDPQTWDDYCLSPCINPALPPTIKEHRKSIIGSISDSISSNLPSMASVNGKRVSLSWANVNPFNSEPETAANVDAPTNNAPSNGPALPLAESSLEPTMKTGAGSSSNAKPSIGTACTIPLPEAKAYLARTLSSVLAFKTALTHIPTHQHANHYPPHAVIFGKSVPTVYGARVHSREHIKYTDAFDNLAFASGDGVVLASAAQLPEGYRCVKAGRAESDRGM